nr:hypothetical protein [Gammaproteobacteria bacterium]
MNFSHASWMSTWGSYLRSRLIRGMTVLLGTLVVTSTSALEVSGYLSAEIRGFLHTPRFVKQKRHSASVVAQPEFYHQWDEGN